MAGTNMEQEKYLDLEKTAEQLVGRCDSSTVFTDAEAKVLINSEFGFETSRIKILKEGEIDVTEKGDRYTKLEKVPRKPVYASTDWNYIRFNIRLGNGREWYYEMINGHLHQVYI